MRRQTNKKSVPEDQIISKQGTRISKNQEEIVKRGVQSGGEAYSRNENTVLAFEFRALDLFRGSDFEFRISQTGGRDLTPDVISPEFS